MALGDSSLGHWTERSKSGRSFSGTIRDINLWLWEILLWDRERSKSGTIGDPSLGQRDLNLGLWVILLWDRVI